MRSDPATDLELLLPPGIRVPRSRGDAVQRTRAENRLDQVMDFGVGLVCAPAGYGKTTVLASWAESLRQRADVSWLSLRPIHNDPAVLAMHLQAALGPSLPDRAAGGLGETLAALVGSVLHRRRPLTLILDDLDAIENPQVLAALTLLFQRRPSGLAIVAGARSRPPLPWHVFSGHGSLVEVGPIELQFEWRDTHELLVRRFGLSLPEDQVVELCKLTRGWVTALCLAGLIMQGRDDPSAVVSQRLAGHRHVRQFFDEVLHTQSPAAIAFLETTSVLERLDPVLCDVLTGRDDSLEVLRDLVTRGLFTEELEGDAPAFAYHPLLRAHLRARLSAQRHDEVSALLDTASRWYEGHGADDAAIRLALEGGDLGRAVRLIRGACGRAIRYGFGATAAGWLLQLPKDVLADNPDLLLALGRASGLGGDLVTARAALRDASAALTPRGRRARHGLLVGRAQLELSVLVWDGHLVSAQRALDEAMTLFEESLDDPALEMLSIDEEAMRAQAATVYLLGGQWDRAVEAVDGALNVEHIAHPTRYTILMLGVRAAALAWAGDETRARDAVRQSTTVLRRFSGTGSDRFLLECAAAWVMDGPSADSAADAAAAIAVRIGLPVFRAAADLASARLNVRRGRVDVALRALASAEEAIAAVPEPSFLVTLVERLRLEIGDAEPSPEVPELQAREIEVLSLIADGATRSQVARRLNLSVNTVKTHLRTTYRKLGVHSRGEAVTAARALGLLPKD
jgi:LuxR family maltose regulon positive regulatory protein